MKKWNFAWEYDLIVTWPYNVDHFCHISITVYEVFIRSHMFPSKVHGFYMVFVGPLRHHQMKKWNIAPNHLYTKYCYKCVNKYNHMAYDWYISPFPIPVLVLMRFERGSTTGTLWSTPFGHFLKIPISPWKEQYLYIFPRVPLVCLSVCPPTLQLKPLDLWP